MLNGRLTPKWSELHAEHLFTINNTEKHLPGTSVVSMHMQSIATRLDPAQQGYVDGHDENRRNEARRVRAEIMLREIYPR